MGVAPVPGGVRNVRPWRQATAPSKPVAANEAMISARSPRLTEESIVIGKIKMRGRCADKPDPRNHAPDQHAIHPQVDCGVRRREVDFAKPSLGPSIHFRGRRLPVLVQTLTEPGTNNRAAGSSRWPEQSGQKQNRETPARPEPTTNHFGSHGEGPQAERLGRTFHPAVDTTPKAVTLVTPRYRRSAREHHHRPR